MAETTIEWTDKVWNPVRGCTRVSEGCTNCYAERTASRFSGPGMPYEGLIRSTSKGPLWTGKIRLVPEKLKEPLTWRTPCRVFVNSMSDLFHEGVPDSFIAEVFATMAACPRHTFQVLTKRPERMRHLLAGPKQHAQWPREMWHRSVLPNVWLGVSVENQEAADERIPLLLETPAAVRWISAEPLLGPVNLGRAQIAGRCGYYCDESVGHVDHGKVNWCVVGGESGPGSRPMHPDWARSLRDECQQMGIAYFFKQWGAWADVMASDAPLAPSVPMTHPGLDDTIMVRVGKKAAGRLLDGRTWDEYPVVS